jgi:lysylphosphatidylglycerol synthetase-like protein (DUF2156 family)
MDERCTCDETRNEREREAGRLALRPDKRHVIRRSTPDGYTETSVGFIVAATVVVAVFVAAIVTAVRASGYVSVVSIVVTVVLGLYIAWTVLLLGLLQIIVKIIRYAKETE